MRTQGLLLLLFLAVACISMGACTLAVGSTDGQYGEALQYMSGRTINLPDFSIEYIGEHRVYPPQYQRGFLYHDFQVKSGSVAQTVSWTDGTGELGPIDFEFSGTPYTLELTERQTIGSIGYGTLIVEKLQ
jgi:hypothetical protein